jgi:outer membrane immunogenic protein
MNRILAGAAVLAAVVISGSAGAADMPVKAPVPPPAPILSWTGCYFGGNIGGGSPSKDWSNPSQILFPDEPGDHGEADFDGFVGGGQIGCDYHFIGAGVVIGIQGMFDAGNLRGNVIDTQDADFDLTNRVHWFAMLTGRLGFTLHPNWLVYVKGGAAWVRDHHLTLDLGVPFDVADITRTGWTVGAGAEWMFLPNWSLFLEYDFMDFGNRAVPFQFVGGGFSENWNIRQNVQTLLAGLNFRFNWGILPYPVAAGY